MTAGQGISGWYDAGGVLPAGRTRAQNDTDAPEQVRRGRDYINGKYGAAISGPHDPGDTGASDVDDWNPDGARP